MSALSLAGLIDDKIGDFFNYRSNDIGINSNDLKAIAAELRRLDADNAALRSQLGQGTAVYQWREIGEGEWTNCTKEWYDHASKSPELDTRIISAPQSKPVDELGAPKNYKKLSEWLEHENSVLKAKVRELENYKPVDEREAFELDYVKKWHEESPMAAKHTIEFLCSELKEMRQGDKYGEGQDYLNFKWEGWQARAALKPVVPVFTEKMLQAGLDSMGFNSPMTTKRMREVVDAMLAAAKGE